jgi:hypothetical protein
VFAAYRLYFKANGYSLLHRAARLFLPEVSTLTADIRVPSLPGSPGTGRLFTKQNTLIQSNTAHFYFDSNFAFICMLHV